MGNYKKLHDLYSCCLKFRLSRSQYDFLLSYSSKYNLSISDILRRYIDYLMSHDDEFVKKGLFL